MIFQTDEQDTTWLTFHAVVEMASSRADFRTTQMHLDIICDSLKKPSKSNGAKRSTINYVHQKTDLANMTPRLIFSHSNRPNIVLN